MLTELLSDLLYRFRALFRRRGIEADMEEELRFHLDREAEKLERSGIQPDAAVHRARVEFGPSTQIREQCRDARGTRWLEESLQDIRYGLRGLRRTPAFALTAIFTIALGIAAVTAMFSVTNAVLLRPLPYRDPGRLVLAIMDLKKANVRDFAFSNPLFFDFRNDTRGAFEDLSAIVTYRLIAPREDGTPERIFKAMVMPNFFRTMGASIALGRDFSDADAQPIPDDPRAGIPQGAVAILSFEYWQRRYGGNPAVIGNEMITYGRRGPRIAGVLAPGFKLYFPPAANIESNPDVWVANNLGNDPNRSYMPLRVIGRLSPNVTLRQAQDQVAAVQQMRLEPMLTRLSAEVRPAILALMGAVCFVLLIACANVANLLLVRSSLRARELAMRAALGGSWARLLRQMLVEALLLSTAGTLAGIAIAWLAVRELIHIAPASLPRIDSANLDWRVVAFSSLAGLAAAALFGTIPALRAARPDLIRLLRGAGTGVVSGRLLRNSVVTAEVTLGFILLIGSGLMLRSFAALQRIDPGYDPHHLLTLLMTRDRDYASSSEKRQAMFRAIRARLLATPGVKSVSASAGLPLTRSGSGGVPWTTDAALARQNKLQPADFDYVLPGYFETLRTRLIEGRTYTDADNAPGRRVIVIDDSLAAKAFPHRSAIGQRIFICMPDPEPMEVIGVVAHQRQDSLAEPGREQFYLTDGYIGMGASRYWSIRTAGDPATLAPLIRAALAQLDPQLLMLDVQPMDARVAQAESGTRFSLLLIGVFATVAALLAAVGLYGVLSTAVRQRTAEIGIRVALGAAPRTIFALFVGHGLRLAMLGIAIGLILAPVLTRAMAGMLIGVRPSDPTTFAAMVVLFLILAAVASWLPARRAAKLDPLSALREA